MPLNILHRWIAAVNNNDLDTVTSLYSEDSVLMPTFSSRTLTTSEQRKSYFQQLASREGLSVSLHPKTLHNIPVSPTAAIVGGIYLWQFIIDDEPLHFEARFSYLIDASLPHPILHHHSSQIPRNLS
jgi:hypothetical protein